MNGQPIPIGQPGPVRDGAGSARGPGGIILPKRVVVPCSRNADLSGKATSGTAILKVETPSCKLRCHIELGFAPAAQRLPTTYNSSVWTLRAMRPAMDEAGECELHALESAVSLPTSYELDSALRLVKATATLFHASDSGTELTGAWVFSVTWEPTVEMCAEEAEYLYGKCFANLVRNAGIIWST